MIFQIGVKILVANEEGEFLVLKRNTEKYPEAGATWDIPGGRIEIGTPLIENLARELREETGLTLLGNPDLVYAQDILKNEEKHVVRLTYIGKAEGEIVLDIKENTEYAWKSKTALLSMSDLDQYLREALLKLD
jgi:8-oxo-dGTP diphosphatase